MSKIVKIQKTKRAGRKRRTSADLLPILESRKNEFQDWCYAGNPETMRMIIPDFDKQMKVFEKLSFHIPDEKFCDPLTIKVYGENLRKARKGKGFTRKEVVSVLSIHDQNLAEIEDGKRKEIDRDILLLLCGTYHQRPEVLMGMEPFGKDPMDFFEGNESEKADFILRKLYSDAPTLLHALLMMSAFSPQKRGKLVKFIRSDLDIEIFNAKQITQLIRKTRGKKKANRYSKSNFLLDLDNCLSALYELAKKDPELLDAYISIASAKKEKYPHILGRLISAGFLE